jgi:DNA-directed RNA polymerase subunit RPC12/RpoP
MVGISMNVFNSFEHLEPKCPNCGSKIEYGVTTEYSDEANTHLCLSCGHRL